ncbi:MAG: phosphatase PAP2 family protein, partial [Calditrichaeota bacterium]|nr:phosphatase PAP2 family protein [Calditrichota bacterium]
FLRQKTAHLIAIYLSIALFLLISTAVIAHFQLDLKVQRLFYDHAANPGWYQKNAPLWHFLYHYGPLPALLLSFAAIAVLIFQKSVPKLRKYKHASKLFLLAMILGPGVIINGVLKDHWGRPRPRQVEEFGGQWEFREIWQPGIPGKGKSFPCGHASAGFIFFALFLALRDKHKKIAWFSLFFSLIYGSLIGVARMAQGGHFLSDVIWSWGITWLIILILYYHILKIPDEENQTKPEKQQPNTLLSGKNRILMTIAFVFSVAFLVFFFLFSKPAYKEFHYRLPRSAALPILKIDFQVEHGDVVFVPDSLSDILQIDGTMQGFGFPEFKFKNDIAKQISGDTLKLTFAFALSGFFYEKGIVFTCRFDSTERILFGGKVKNGDLFLKTKDNIKKIKYLPQSRRGHRGKIDKEN